MSTVAEDTSPAEADLGLRRISVTVADGSRISVSVLQETKADDPEGEIHRQGIAYSRAVVTNEQLTKALIQIASAAVKSLNHQSL